jgi:hypothetical protein
MNPIELDLPDSARVLFNSLYETTNAQHLTQDLLAVLVPRNRVIDVGWEPEFDANGHYVVSVFERPLRQVEYSRSTKSLEEVKALVEELALRYSPVSPIASGPD